MIDFTDRPQPFEVPGSRVPVIFGPGRIVELGRVARRLGGTRVLLVTDPGIESAGHAARAIAVLEQNGLRVTVFDGVEENPTGEHVAAGAAVARQAGIDLIAGLGGGSAMDTAKGINFIHTNGGRMADYWGTQKAAREMLPFVAIPTTAGTGSEAQKYAVISDAGSHRKMACGDSKALASVAILDPELTATMPRSVAAITGLDAISHAVESAACTARTNASRRLSAEAWARLDRAYERALAAPGDSEARADMLIGSHLAGAAIENSMLGAAHSCANPLTARFGITHGVAVVLCLPHVIRFNAAAGDNPYGDLCEDAGGLAARIEHLRGAAGLPDRLGACGVTEDALVDLAAAAAEQWTAQFNPRPVGPPEFLELYRTAM